MKRNKIASILYFICAILWAAGSVLNALSSNIPMCAVYLGLSTTHLCLGIMYSRRAKDDANNSADK